jgi:hypothetical protein
MQPGDIISMDYQGQRYVGTVGDDQRATTLHNVLEFKRPQPGQPATELAEKLAAIMLDYLASDDWQQFKSTLIDGMIEATTAFRKHMEESRRQFEEARNQ